MSSEKIKKYNSIKKILDELDCEMMYLNGTLEHIECWTTEYQEKNNYKPSRSLDHSAHTIHADLSRSVKLIKKLMKIKNDK